MPRQRKGVGMKPPQKKKVQPSEPAEAHPALAFAPEPSEPSTPERKQENWKSADGPQPQPVLGVPDRVAWL